MTEVESKQTLESTFSQPMIKSLNHFKLGISNIIYQISIAKDGNTWCALLGQDLQNGIGGFGETVQQALHDLANKIPE